MQVIQNRAIALLVTFTLVFTSLWATSPEAFADAIKADTPGYLHDLAEHSKAGDHAKNVKPGPVCNHGCHMSAHLAGFVETTPIVIFTLPRSQAVVPFSVNLSENPYLQGPFRPPLVFSLV
jgi:hypothetical protein